MNAADISRAAALVASRSRAMLDLDERLAFERAVMRARSLDDVPEVYREALEAAHRELSAGV